MNKNQLLALFVLLLFYLIQVAGALLCKPLATFFWSSFGITLFIGLLTALGFVKDSEDTEEK